ncbi:DNA polymerase II [Sansalvadorimonas verongulae]|uniref:DNA polymerase II n=1 Tax=Sansalvadorimonas verongulae TaxID=2172824 RepID=UPI002E3328C3|nr:DNA polymerase II [Sansalvadorimonas verongulae]MTI12265.1 DNA polymerase II [Sansalvadorimonas verongulae]
MKDIKTGFLLTRTSFDRSRRTEVVLWVLTSHGPARLVVEGEQPVFFIPQKQLQRCETVLCDAGVPVRSRLLELKTFQSEPVSALYFLTIELAWQGRKALQGAGLPVYEADFRLQDRYLMERFVNGGLEFTGQPKAFEGFTEYRKVKVRPAEYRPAFRVVSFDLECSAEGELYSAGFYGHGPDGDKDELVLMVGAPEPGTKNILWAQDEQALLEALVLVIRQWDPDIIIGWNVINFDFRLLLKRAEFHGFRLPLGRGGDNRQRMASWRDRKGEEGQGFISIPGRMVIDGIDSLKAMTMHFDSFSLEFVGQALLGRGKDTEDVDNRIAAITHDFHHNKQKLARYNLEDCRLVLDIFEHTRLLDYLRLRSQLTGLELDRQGGSVAAFTNLYLPRLHRAGYIAPNLPEGGGLASPGGYVMDSVPGLYDNVLVLDFKSLYPSIIRTFKIDPLGLVEGLLEPDDAIPGFRGGQFSREKHFLPDIIASLWQQRDEAKREKDAARSQALKIIMNSFYGVLGSGGCRFYDTRLASSITMRGHNIMQQTARWIEERGYKVIYGDTDSTFVLLGGGVSPQQADSIGKELEGDINQRWQKTLRDEFDLDCFLELEYETLYTRFLMPTIRGSEAGSKKRYAGLKKTVQGEELVFKGLETVRSDWTELAKSFQTELFEKVFARESPEATVKDYVARTRGGEMDSQLVYRKRLRRHLHEYVKNIPPQVRAARQADEQNERLGKSLRYQHKGWISYLITVAGPEAVEHHQSSIDYEHYIERQLKPVAEGVLPFIGLDFDQLIDEQQSLF